MNIEYQMSMYAKENIMDQIQNTTDSRARLLIVDDAPVMLAFLQRFLSREFDVQSAPDASSALAVLRDGFKPDIFLLDLQMPGLNGFDLLKKLKDFPEFSGTPVMVLSGSDKSADRVACLQHGAADFLLKPFNPDELALRLQKHLSKNESSNPFSNVKN